MDDKGILAILRWDLTNQRDFLHRPEIRTTCHFVIFVTKHGNGIRQLAHNPGQGHRQLRTRNLLWFLFSQPGNIKNMRVFFWNMDVQNKPSRLLLLPPMIIEKFCHMELTHDVVHKKLKQVGIPISGSLNDYVAC